MIAEQLTLVIVGYRHERYVTKLLETVEKQTMLPKRILLVDDDPAGGTADVAESYLVHSPLQVEITRNEVNRGLCTSLNAALAEINTEYYAYISADDWMRPARIERQFEAISAAPSTAALVYSNAIRVDETDRELPEDFKTAYEWPTHRTGNVYTEMSAYNWLPAPSVMLRTQAVRDVGGYDPELFFEDHDLWLRLAVDHDFLCVDEPLVAFRELGSSLGHQQFQTDNPKFVVAYLQILAKQLGIRPEIDADMLPRLWSLALRLWRIEGATPRVVEYLASYVQGAQNPRVGKAYVRIAKLGFSYASLDRIRSLVRR
ncbi:MAG: glycosyltransferase family 2 protein [Pseudoclavibacter sp.]